MGGDGSQGRRPSGKELGELPPRSICLGSNRRESRCDSMVGNIFRNPKPEPLDLTIKRSQEGRLRCNEKPFLSVWGASRAGF